MATRLNFVNTRGIPAIEAVSSTQSSTGLDYQFRNHPYVGSYFQGLLVVKITGTPTPPGTAVPVTFSTQGVPNSTIAVSNTKGEAYTTGSWEGDGVYLMFYDRTTNVLRLINAT